MYRRYKKRRYYNNGLNPIEMLADIIVSLAYITVELTFKLIKKLASSSNNARNSQFKITDDYTINTRDEEISEHTNLPITNDTSGRYELKKSLITPTEADFLKVLKEVVGDKYIIENQVQLSRIVTPLDSGKNYTNYTDFNKIKAKSIDFVLFDKQYKPYLCIELDDRSHLRFDRIKRDLFVDDIMEGVGLKIIHIPVSYMYNQDKLNKQIFE